jgi:hypothetical protein
MSNGKDNKDNGNKEINKPFTPVTLEEAFAGLDNKPNPPSQMGYVPISMDQIEATEFSGFLKGLPKPYVSSLASIANFNNRINPLGNIDSQDNPGERFVKLALENVDKNGKYRDRNNNLRDVDFLKAQFADDRWLGDGLIYLEELGVKGQYLKKIDQAEEYAKEFGLSENWKEWPMPFGSNQDERGLLTQKIDQRLNDNIIWRGLYATEDPETGEPILKEVVGPLNEIREKYNILPKYGYAKSNSNVLAELYKSTMNTLSGTDDAILGVSKMLQAPLKWTGIVGDNTALDRLHEATLAESDLLNYMPSKESGEMGSAQWWASGVGAVVGSQNMFGLIGRGARYSFSALNAIAAKGGVKALQATAINAASRYTASGIVGFGFAYNEAKQNGLSENESFAFAIPVGFLVSLIESKLGVQLDKHLIGGSKGLSKAILKEAAGDFSDEALKKSMIKVTRNYFANASKMMLPEGIEEGLQNITETGGKIFFNAVILDKNNIAGEGKFEKAQFDFLEILTDSMFGLIGSFPNSMMAARGVEKKIIDHVLDGKVNDLKISLSKLLTIGPDKGGITQEQFRNLNAKIDKLNEIYITNEQSLKNVSGKHGNPLKEELFGLHGTQMNMAIKRQTIVDNSAILDTKNQTPEQQHDAAKKVKEQLEEIDKQSNKIAEAIKKFEDPNYISERVKEIDGVVKQTFANRDNYFAQLAEAEAPLQTADDIVSRYKKLSPEQKKTVPVMRNVDEVSVMLEALENGYWEKAEDKSYVAQKIKDELLETGLYLSPRLSAKRDQLLSLGIGETLLPFQEGSQEKLAAQQGFDALLLDPNVKANMLAEMEPADVSAFNKKAPDEQKYDTAKHVVKNKDKYGLTPQQVQSLDNSSSLEGLFDKDKLDAITKLLKATNKPLSLVLSQGLAKKEAKGLYSNQSELAFIEGDFNTLRDLQSRKDKLTKKEQELYKILANDLFHKISHELGHSLWDNHLEELFVDYVKAVKSGKQTAESIHFKRLLDLASLGYNALNNKADKGSYFFNTIAPGYNNKKINELTFVREFFAEALSNKVFQEQLDSFDINDRKNEGLVQQFYNYKRIPGKPASLLGEIVKAMTAVFHKLKNVFTKPERTLLQEAFVLGSTLQVNKYIERHPQDLKNDLDVDFAHEQDAISAYNAMDLFEGYGVLDMFNLATDIADKLISQDVGIGERGRAIAAFENLIAKEVLPFAEDNNMQEDSLRVIFFKETPTVLITFKTAENKTQRIFANPYGDRIYVNTNPFNRFSPVTMAKHDAFAAFEAAAAVDEYQLTAREMVNNLYRAQQEGFVGDMHLEYDEQHAWSLGDRQLYGQVRVIYRFPNGEQAAIGYTHDLTKIRLAKLMSNGARIHVSVDQDRKGIGSKAMVKVSENGSIVDVRNAHETLIDQEERLSLEAQGYTEQRIAPRLNLLYNKVQNLSKETVQEADNSDSLTTDNETVDIPKDIFTREEIIKNKIVDDSLAKELGLDLSFYDNPEAKEKLLNETLEYVKEGFSRRIRHLIANHSSTMKEGDLDIIANTIMYNHAIPHVKDVFKDDPETLALVEFMGFQSEEELQQFIAETLDKDWKKVTRSKDRHNADYSGEGQNPNNTISKRIKFAVEKLTFENEDGKKEYIDFVEVRDIMFRASVATVNPQQYIDNIKKLGESMDENYRTRQMAGAIWNYLSQERRNEDGSFKNGEMKLLEESLNSWWSQISSYGYNDSITIIADGDSVRHVYNSHTQMLKGEVKAIVGGIKGRVDQIREEAKELGIDPKELFHKRLNEHFGNPILTQDGLPSSLIKKINSDNTYLTQKRMGFMGGENKYQGDKFKEVAERLRTFFDFVGLEIPETMLSEAYSKPEHFINFTRAVAKGNNQKGYDRVDGNYPMIQLLAQTAQFLNTQIEQDLLGKDVKYDLSELKILGKKLAVFHTGYRTPEFYHGVNFEKKMWSYKLKSYRDALLERLTHNMDGTLDDYLSSDMYKENLVVHKIKNSQGVPVQLEISGLKGYEGNPNVEYKKAIKLDYYYMALSGYVMMGDTEYAHLDDVPSDKPRNVVAKLDKINPKQFQPELQRIIDTEKRRVAIAEQKFKDAFSKAKGQDVYYVSEGFEQNFDNLIEGVHYINAGPKVDGKYQELKDEKGRNLYKKGRIFDNSTKFYDGLPAGEIYSQIEKEAQADYDEMVADGLRIPVPQSFLQSERKGRTEEEFQKLLAEKRRELFKEFSFNYVINRYHLSQLLMGDSVFYKGGDDFLDLNKRKSNSPIMRGSWNRPTGKLALLNDVEDGKTPISLNPLVWDEDANSWTISTNSENAADINSNRTDAQGYVTESFAQEIIKAYGSFANYEKVFKPMLFGVNKAKINEAQPLYLKLSIVVVPDPGTLENPKNEEHYRMYPEQKAFAEKVYNAKADIAVFTSGVKVGISNVSNTEDAAYKTQDFDLNLFGLQNDPNHGIDEDNLMTGMTQTQKFVGDNDNFKARVIADAIEAGMLQDSVDHLFNTKLSNIETITAYARDTIDEREHTQELGPLMDAGVRLDNPVIAKQIDPVLNSSIKRNVSLAKKDGEKMVNLSEFGLGRPVLSETEVAERNRIVKEALLEKEVGEYDTKLRWIGTRTLGQLTNSQLKKAVEGLANGTITVDDYGTIIDANGNVKIYPADVLVPSANGVYDIGDNVIAIRIPTSAMNSIIAGEVVGFLPDAQGNVVAVGQEGPGVLGFDFDVDGLFTWRKAKKPGKRESNINKMFDTYFDILTDPRNYNEIITPVSTDTLKGFADTFSPKTKSRYSRYSFARQAELHTLNTVGKQMVGIVALGSGVHAVLSQNPTKSPFIPQMINETIVNYRRYLADGEYHNEYMAKYFDKQGNEKTVRDAFVQLLNSSLDNVKLMFNGRIHFNPDTASVVMDMISHGISLDYALYFVNQPIIKEYVATKAKHKSATFLGDKENLWETISRVWENKAQTYKPGYVYNPVNEAGASTRSDIVYKYSTMSFGLAPIKDDRRNISMESLELMFEGERNGTVYSDPNAAMDFIDSQLAILEKFRYYNELAKITAGASTLVSLVSKYPKSFIGLIEANRKIIDAKGGYIGERAMAPKIDIYNLTDTDPGNPDRQPIYALNYATLNRLIEKYQEFKLYARPEILAMHKEIAGGAPLDVQEKIMEDFYSYVLSQSKTPNLKTSSINGKVIDPVYFVESSAKMFEQLKLELPDNQFLEKLNIKPSEGTRQQIIDKEASPSVIETNLLYDLDPKKLAEVHADFNALPENYEYRGDIVNTKDVLLGHLLYTKGFGLGGFSYSKILPVEVIKSFDTAITEFADYMDMRNELLPEELAVIEDPRIEDFKIQALLNNPTLIPELKANEMALLYNTNGDKHIDLWVDKETGKDNAVPDAKYRGHVRIVQTYAGETELNIYRDFHNEKRQKLVDRILQKGVVRIDGKVYVVTGKANARKGLKSVTIESLNFIPVKGVKQYVKGNFNVMLENDPNIDNLIVDTNKIDFSDALSNSLVVPGADIPAITTGAKIGVTLPDAQVKQGQRIAITDGDWMTTIVQVTKAPYSLQEHIDKFDRRNGKGGLEAVKKRWAEVEGVSVDQWTDDTANQMQFQFEYVAAVDQDGEIVHWNRKHDPNDISSYDNNANQAKGFFKGKLIDSINKLGRDYNRKTEKSYFRDLKKAGATDTEVAILKDHLYDVAEKSLSTDQLIGLLGNDTVEDISFYDNTYVKLNTDQKLSTIFDNLFDGQYRSIDDIESIMNEPISSDFINHATGKVYTHWEWIDKHFKQYEKEEAELMALWDRIQDDNLLGVDGNGDFILPTTELEKLFKDMENNYTSLDKLARKNFGKVFNEVGRVAGNRMLQDKADSLMEANPDVKTVPGQEDIKWWEARYFKSPFDFSERQLAMQFMGKEIINAAGYSNQEKKRLEITFNNHVTKVRELHFKLNPLKWTQKINPFATLTKDNDPLMFMLDADEDGNYSFVKRYEGDEKAITAKIFGRNAKGFYNLSPRNLIKILFDYNYTDMDKLSKREIEQVNNIRRKYGLKPDWEVFYKDLSEEQQATYYNDMQALRKIAVKVMVRAEDSQLFKALKETIRRKPDSGEAELAKAQIELYDFIYHHSEELMMDNNLDGKNMGKAFMPQTSMDVFEELARNGLFSAYLKFMDVDMYDSSIDDVDVSYDGKTMLVSEWKAYYENADFVTKTTEAPRHLKKIIKIAKNDVARNGILRGSEVDFSTSTAVPLRSIAKKEDASINVGRIVANHFNSLIFKKHHDPILPKMRAAQIHYQQLGGNNKEEYKNVLNFINWYSDRYFFGKKDPFSNTLLGKAIERSVSVTVMAHLGLSPITSGMNLAVGTAGEVIALIGDYGYGPGLAKYALGVKRLSGKSAGSFNSFSGRVKKGRLIFNPKAMAILAEHNVETFSNMDVERHNDVFQKFQDLAMILQSNTELIIRGQTFLGGLTDAEWDNYELNEDGSLGYKDPNNLPKIEKVAAMNFYINQRQGDYTTEGRPNYHGIMVAKMAMLFKGWLVKFINYRFGTKKFDQYDKQTEGFYRTTLSLLKDHKRLMSVVKGDFDKLSLLEQQNLRKLSVDVLLLSLLLVLQAPLDDDDPTEAYWRKLLNKYQWQLMMQFNVQDWMSMIVQPFPSMYMFENIIDGIEGLTEWNLKKSGTAIYNLIPGRKAYEFIDDIVD